MRPISNVLFKVKNDVVMLLFSLMMMMMTMIMMITMTMMGWYCVVIETENLFVYEREKKMKTISELITIIATNS